MKTRTEGKQKSVISMVIIALTLIATLLPSGQLVSGAGTEQNIQSETLGQLPPASLAPPGGLVVQATNALVTLTWNAVVGASEFRVYRTQTEGVNFALIGSVPANRHQEEYIYKDQTVVNRQVYYYVITTVDQLGVESLYSNEVSAVPHLMITWAGTIKPATIPSYTMGFVDPLRITGKFLIRNATGLSGPAPGIIAHFGYGPAGTAPITWKTWFPATYAGLPQDETPIANDLYEAIFRPSAPGDYNYVFRFSSDLGRTWMYGGVMVPIDPALPHSETNELGSMHVVGGTDTSIPSKPTNLHLLSVTKGTVQIGWNASTDNALYLYIISRATTPGGPYTNVGSLAASAAQLQYTDKNLIAGTNYYYVVKAIDTSYNQSPNSNELAVTTTASLLTVTLRVSVPAFTKGNVYLNRSIGLDGTPGGENWTAIQLLPDAAPNTYKASLTLREGAKYSFRVSRGSQVTQQTNGDGNSLGFAPDFTVTAGVTLVERTVLNWDDPIVVAHWPSAGLQRLTKPISATWNQAMPATTLFTVQDITGTPTNITGKSTYLAESHTVIFTPDNSLPAGHKYSVLVTGQKDMKGIAQVAPFTWTFTVDQYQVLMPYLSR